MLTDSGEKHNDLKGIYEVKSMFPDFFVYVFRIVVDS